MTTPGEMPRKPGRRRRLARRALWVGLVLIAGLPLLAWLAERGGLVQTALVSVADRTLREEFQLGLDARRLTIRDFGRRVTAEGLVIGPPDRPLATIDRLEARLDPGSLFGKRPTIQELRVSGLRIDTAGLPDAAPAGGGGAGPPASPGLTIERFEVRDLSVVAAPLGEAFDPWLDRWSLDDFRLDGALDGGRLSVDALAGDVRVESHRRPPIEARLEAAGVASLEGTFEAPTLSLVGDGLSLTGRVDGAWAPRFALDARLETAVDVGRLFPDLTEHGSLDGQVALTRGAGTTDGFEIATDVEAREFPGELLQPLTAGTSFEELDFAGTRLDARADLRATIGAGADGARPNAIDGTVDVDWHRGPERWIVAHVVASSGDRARARVELELLPGEPGARHLAGVVDASGWAWPAREARVEARLSLDLVDLADPRWYFGLDRSSDWTPTGDLRATATLAGALDAPTVEADLQWSVDERVALEATARSAVGGEALAIVWSAELLPDEGGERSLRGTWSASDAQRPLDGRLDDGHVTLDLPDTAATVRRLLALTDRIAPAPIAAAWRSRSTDASPLLRGAWRGTGSFRGPASALAFEVDTTWLPAPGERLQVTGEGTLAPDRPWGVDDLALDVVAEGLTIAPFVPSAEDAPTVGGRLAGRLTLAGFPARPDGSLELTGTGLRIGNGPEVTSASVAARADGEVVELTRLEATLARPLVLPGTAASPADAPPPPRPSIRGTGTLRLGRPIREGVLRLEGRHVAAGIETVNVAARLADGRLAIDASDVRYAGDRASLMATVPLGSLGSVSEQLSAAGVLTAPGPLRLDVTSVAVAPLLSLFGVDSAMDARVDGTLVADPNELTAARGELHVTEMRAEVDDESIALNGDLRIEIGDGTVVLPPTELSVDAAGRGPATPLRAAATVRLAPEWRPGDPPTALLADVAATLDGTVEAALFNPFVPGVRATGAITLDADVAGPPDALDLTLALTGRKARLFHSGQYPIALEDPDILLSLRDGRPRLDHARGRLNGGRFEATGRLEDDTPIFRATVREARLRLDFGITAQLDADLELRWPATGLRELSGRVVVDRAVLRRDVNLEREALRVLFEPDGGANLRALERIALDLTVDTREGVFVDNNLADLHADWSGLRVSGTLAQPRLNGRVDVAPGGWLSAFGVVYRIDELFLSWTDAAPSDVRLVIETTSSIDDPSLLQQYRGLTFAGVGGRGPGQGGQLDFRGEAAAGQAASVTAAIASYYQDKLAGAVGGGQTELSFEPIPLFGETDTQARYTLWQHVNANTSLIWSVDPRQSEAQTWIADLHGFRFAPRWRMQLFTKDAVLESGVSTNSWGATIQQTLEFGGGKPIEDPRPVLREVVVHNDGELSKRRIRSAAGYRKGDPFAEGALLDVEVDVIDLLRRRGYPAGEVDVHLVPQDGERAVLEISVEEGERVDFLFEGEKLPRAARREIRGLYRPLERDKRAALDAMKAETVAWLRRQGFLFPTVEVELLPADPAADEPQETVRVAMDGGRQIEPGPPEIRGIPEADVGAVAAQFRSTLERVELAAGLPDADAALVQTLRAIGYPDARVVGRELSDDGERLAVDVASGPRQQVTEIAFDGVDADEAERLARHLRFAEGDPPRFAEISLSAQAMEDDLASRGHAEAHVRSRVTSGDPPRSLDTVVTFEVTPGPVYRIADVRFEGLQSANRRWVERNAGLEAGELLRREDVAEARRQLYRTGVFRRIQVEGDRPSIERRASASTAPCGPLCPGAGAADPAASAEDEAPVRDTELVFDVRENRRYQLSYGLRWQSDLGLGFVVDAVDRNSLGRGHVTGARAIYGREQKSLRLYHQIPRIVRHKSSLEFFVEGGEQTVDTDTTAETLQFWTQFTTPLGPRTQTRVYTVFEKLTLVADDRRALDERVISPRLGWQWIFTTVDRALGRERHGWFLGIDISGGHEALGSDVTTIAAFEQVKYFWSFGRKKRYNWAQSWRFGLVDARDQEIPLADRLRAGGSYSVRGYPTNSLGARTPDGLALGGEVQFIVNQELHRVIAGPVAAVVFFDAGNVWPSLDALDDGLFTSVGLGVRYGSPIGPLRVDVAWPLDRRPEDPTWQVYFGFGQVF